MLFPRTRDRLHAIRRELNARYAATWALRETGRFRDKVRAARFILTGVIRWH